MAKFTIDIPIQPGQKPELEFTLAIQKLNFELSGNWNKQFPIRIMDGKREQARIRYHGEK